jgi:dissimilatory sulfite reductase (desulfoviridin) alpha/beta subunit
MNDREIDYEDLKKRGFLKQKQEGFFVLRTRMSSGVYKKEEFDKISEIAGRYGKGYVHATTRQGLEVPFIKFEDIPSVEKEILSINLAVGTSGARLRPTTVCPGNNWCKQGLVDTFSLAGRIEDAGLKSGLDLPHKFKIAISGCPNGCTRSQFSEIGIHGQVDTALKLTGYAVYLGGCGGRAPKNGIRPEKIFTEDEIVNLAVKIIKFFKDNAKPRQRFAALIEEFGRDRFLKEVVG